MRTTQMEYNEKELIESSQNGNSQAYGQLYDRHIKTIYNFIYYKTRHKETAEDLTSQTFYKALRHMSSVDSSRSFLSWLYKIAHNTVLDHYRVKKNLENIDDFYDLDDGQESVEIEIDDREEAKKVKKYLDKLSAIERDIVIMRVWQELSYKEIAEIVGKTEASCKMMYSRSLKKLRDLVPLALFLLFISHL
ncbi:MAG: sigma-70 family RNA polymerase sigma factor [bacterium]|nr:sigma-70 family RNA polymerase sigma factor [bacterium]